MVSMPFTEKNFMQLCWVVPDLRAAMAAWTKASGIGPFFFFEQVTFTEPVYRGKPAESVDVSAAIAQAGEMQIELVAQNDNRISIWRDLVPAGKTGFHHAALYCKNYDTDLAAYKKAGAEVAFSGRMMGARTCWVDTTPTLGFMIELIEANPIADVVFAKIREPAKNWDGLEPVRTLT